VTEPAEPAERDQPDGPSRSGLKNPSAAVNGVGMAALLCEFVVILLAIQPIRIVSPHTSGSGLAIVAACAVACLAVVGTLRRRWGWAAAVVLQIVLIVAGVSGYAHWMLTGVGVVFLLAWVYLLSVRRTVIGNTSNSEQHG
jgi:lysylphosphatidylglycerol synthetase-like protein (DUF2156 family)